MKDKLPEGYEHTQETVRTKAGTVMMPIMGKKMRSVCCNELLLVFVRANSEVEIRCSKCMQYIGHLAPRAYALLYQSLPGSIRETMQELGFDGEITKEALIQIHGRYSELLIASAGDCIKQAVAEHMKGGETVVELQGEEETGGTTKGGG